MPTVPGEANPYLRIVEDERPPAQPPAANPYLAQFEQDKARQDKRFTAALQPASVADPDKHAQNRVLAKDAGLPLGAVESDPESVARDLRMRRVADTVSKSPLLQAWMGQDDNAILAIDDYENLSGLETAMRATKNLVVSPFRGFDISVGQGISGLGRLNDIAGRKVTELARTVGLDSVADTLETPIPYWMNPSQWARGVGGVIEESAGPALPEDQQTFATDVGEGLGSLVGQIIASRINPTAGVSLMAGQGAEASGDRAEKAGATTEQTDNAVLLGSVVTAATEKIGLDKLLDRLPPKVKNDAARWISDKLVAGGIEGAQEGVEQLAQNIIARSIYEPDSPVFAGVMDNASVGGAVGFIARSVLGIKVRGQESDEIKAEQTTLDAMVEATAGSKLAQRAPDKFEDFARQAAGAENVYVPAEAVQKLFQSAPEAAAQLGVPVETYMEAVITGSDVAIPVETYLARVAPQFHDQLREVARFTPGSMTPEETAQTEAEAVATAQQFMASDQAQPSSDERVREDVAGMLAETGRFAREDIDKYAQIVQAGFRTLATRQGSDAFDLYSRYRLRIKTEAPAAMAGTDLNTVADPLMRVLGQGPAGEFTAKTKGGEFRLTDAPAVAGSDFSEFGEIREVVAYDGERQIGSLLYANDGTPPTVEVDPDYRRKGVATAMLKLAKQSGGVLGAPDTGVSGKGRPTYRTDDGHAFRTKADEASVEIMRVLSQTEGVDEGAIRRGYISFGSDRQFDIAILEKADATTFLHETGHFFLEVLGDLASDPNAPADIVADYAAALKFMGVESRDQVGTEQHEKWARGFEAYLAEGKAPTAELAPAFSRFKAWMKAIYRTLRNLNVDLTDDVRQVFDRLLATDQEITQAEASMDYAGLFKDANAAGWSDAQFAARLKLNDEAREESEAKLMARAMRDVTRETKAWWNEREVDVRAEVTAEVHAMPVYRALSLLQSGTTPDGTAIEGAGQKLDKGWLERQYGQEWLNKNLLRKRVYSVVGGADPDVIALGVGFSSGDEMVTALANAQPMNAVISAQTKSRMIEQYGDILTDGTMPEQAMRAVHGSKRFKAMEADLRALERLAGEPRPSAAGLRQTANLIIGQKKVRDLQPNTYLRAERKAAKEAIAAAGKGDVGLALEAQRRRLLNAHLYDTASKAQDETDKLRRYIRKFEKPAIRARLGKINRLEQVESLLSQYDMRQVSGKKIDEGKARTELLGLIDAGEIIAPPGLIRSLRAGDKANWRELTVEDLRGIRDILRQTEAAAKGEYEALVNGQRMVLDDIAEKIAADTVAGGKPVMPIYGDLSPEETVKRYGKQALSMWLRPSALARLLDGGKDNGAWTRNLIQPVRRAVVEQLEPMKRKAQEDLAALYSKHYTVKEMAGMNERRSVPGMPGPVTRWDLVSLGLNSGNADNRRAILESEVAGRQPYTEAGVNQALKQLDARDWAFIQDTWDYIDSYWPAIKEAQQRRKGIVPPKVEAQAFAITTRDGQTLDIKGGYYPLKYNARLDSKARQNEMDEAFERMRAGTLSAVQSKYGHTQERVGSGKQPVMLSMNVLHGHINSVIMDLALGDVVNYADRIMTKPQVRQALIETGNLDALETWKLWLKDTATGEIGARSGAEQLAQFIRFGFTKSKIGFNLVTVALQLTGLAQTIPVVGANHTAAAALDLAGRPRTAIRQVMAESAFMRSRYELNTFNKDISSIQEALRSGAPVGKGSGFIGGFINAVRAIQLSPRLVSWAFFGIRMTQIVVDSTTWMAGYRKGAGQGMAHAEAVLYADGIVENAQTSGMFSDRSAIERGTLSESTRQAEFVKLWTTLGSYMIAKGNIAFESYQRTDFRSPSSILSFGSDVMLLFVAEAILMAAIKGGWPEEDEDWWWWTTKVVASQAAGTIPVVREIPSFYSGYGAAGGPIGSTAKDIATAMQQTNQGEVDPQLIKSYTNLIGTATGLPSAQFNRSFTAFWSEAVEGEDVPAYEYIIGKRKE